MKHKLGSSLLGEISVLKYSWFKMLCQFHVHSKVIKDTSLNHFPGCASGKESTCQCRGYKRHGFNLWVGKVPWSRKWQPIPIFLPGKSHGQRSLAGYSLWGCRVINNWACMHTMYILQGYLLHKILEKIVWTKDRRCLCLQYVHKIAKDSWRIFPN